MSDHANFWPAGIQSAVAITVNLDLESFEQPLLPGEPLWGRYSFGRYGAQVGTERLLAALDRAGVRATFFVPGWEITREPALLAEIAAAGHELALRGWANEDHASLDPEAERTLLERAEDAFGTAFGARPLGFRGPSGAGHQHLPRHSLEIPGSMLSGATRALLAERGYRYDSSYCDDDLPYLVADASGKRLVELPHHMTASDRGYYQVYRTPDVVASAWREELAAGHAAGASTIFALSPRGDWGSGRAVRVRAVDALLEAIGETPNLWLATCGELAAWRLTWDEGVVWPA